MDEWYKTEFDRLFPGRVKPAKTPSTPPTSGGLPTPPPTRQSTVPRCISNEEVAQFLGSPHTLVGKRFLHSPPADQGQDQENRGAWEVTSYAIRKINGAIVQEFQIVLETFGRDPLPMDEQEIRNLLQYSTFDA